MTMLNTAIAETFVGAEQSQKATMIATMPKGMLAIDYTDVFSHLGDSNEVWLAYLKRVGAEGVHALPLKMQKAHILPLLKYDTSSTTMVTLMRAGVFVDEALAELEHLMNEHDDGFRIEWFTDGLEAIKHRALPVVLKMMETEDPYELQYAFHAFSVNQWTNKQAIKELSDAVYAVMQVTDKDFIYEHCGRVLTVTAPDQLLEFATESMKTWTSKFDEPLRKAGKYIAEAYHASNNEDVRRKFILQSLESGMPWFDLRTYEAVKVLATMGVDEFKKAFMATTRYTRTGIGGSIRYVGDKPQDEVAIIVEVITEVVYQLLREEYPAVELAECLAQAQDTLGEDNYVNFMVLFQEQGNDAAELSQYHYYRGCTPEEVVKHMQRLDGTAKTDAALMILHKLKDIRNGYRRHNEAFHAAMEVIVGSYTGIGLSIRTRSDESVQNVPFKHWKQYLDRILTDGHPHWAVRFAAYTLKNVDENHELAKSTLARMMLVNDDRIQWYITRFLAGKE